MLEALQSIVMLSAIDSGCTGSLTHHRSALINTRPCDDSYAAADGTIAKASCIGDMPVTVRDARGKPYTVTFRNVRHVPDFKYTLLSVAQLWAEQQIDARFADDQALRLPGGIRIPFASGHRLPSVSMVSSSRHRRSGSALPATVVEMPATAAVPKIHIVAFW